MSIVFKQPNLSLNLSLKTKLIFDVYINSDIFIYEIGTNSIFLGELSTNLQQQNEIIILQKKKKSFIYYYNLVNMLVANLYNFILFSLFRSLFGFVEKESVKYL